MAKDDQISCVIEIEDSLANAIRRYVNEIPVLAIDEIEISRNDSALYDETVAHRIGLVPLKNKPVTDKGIALKLDVKKPGVVYSGELKGSEVIFDKIPLVMLDKDQELKLVATAKAGRGKDHSKFSPGLMFYRNLSELKTSSQAKEVAEIFAKCPNKCSSGTKIENNKTYELDICDACENALEKIGIKITPVEKLYVYVESFGQMNAKDVINHSIKELKKSLGEVSRKLAKA